MKEKPIAFSPLMVRKILDGEKRQTRRPIKPQPPANARSPVLSESHFEPWHGVVFFEGDGPMSPSAGSARSRYWFRDRLWVREPWIEWDECEYRYQAEALTDPPPWWVATATKHQRWKNSMYMPRAAARLFLEIGLIGVEQLLCITETDARAEGFADRAEFLSFWDTLYAKKPQLQAAKNPWVWVYGFRQI